MQHLTQVPIVDADELNSIDAQDTIQLSFIMNLEMVSHRTIH